MKKRQTSPDLFFYMDEDTVQKELSKNRKNKKGKKGGRVYKQRITASEQSRNQLLQQ